MAEPYSEIDYQEFLSGMEGDADDARAVGDLPAQLLDDDQPAAALAPVDGTWHGDAAIGTVESPLAAHDRAAATAVPRRFPCIHCHKCYMSNGARQFHVKHKHGELVTADSAAKRRRQSPSAGVHDMFACDRCGEAFASGALRTAHIEQTHGNREAREPAPHATNGKLSGGGSRKGGGVLLTHVGYDYRPAGKAAGGTGSDFRWRCVRPRCPAEVRTRSNGGDVYVLAQHNHLEADVATVSVSPASAATAPVVLLNAAASLPHNIDSARRPKVAAVVTPSPPSNKEDSAPPLVPAAESVEMTCGERDAKADTPHAAGGGDGSPTASGTSKVAPLVVRRTAATDTDAEHQTPADRPATGKARSSRKSAAASGAGPSASAAALGTASRTPSRSVSGGGDESPTGGSGSAHGDECVQCSLANAGGWHMCYKCFAAVNGASVAATLKRSFALSLRKAKPRHDAH